MSEARDPLVGMLVLAVALLWIPVAMFLLLVTLALPFVAIGAGIAVATEVFGWITGWAV